MSEVKRYDCSGTMCQAEGGDWVCVELLQSAQSEQAALREELAEVSGTLEFNTKCWGRERAVMIDKNQTLIADLLACGRHRKAAEQRNATLAGLLERWYEANCNDLVHVEDGAYRIVLDTNEALTKPTESGASDKCVSDGGTCGLGGQCAECPHKESGASE